ncbi:MAG: hypothetical protein PHC51_01065 [bacterium]|nr:hypothetical protein [bacterium]
MVITVMMFADEKDLATPDRELSTIGANDYTFRDLAPEKLSLAGRLSLASIMSCYELGR